MNQKELYLFLFDYSLKFSVNARRNSRVWEETDFMEMYRTALIEKCRICKRYMYIYDFALAAYYEEAEELQQELTRKTGDLLEEVSGYVLDKIDYSKFRDGVDVKMLLKTTIWTADGYMRQQRQNGNLDPEKWEKEFCGVIDFWKRSYYKEEYL